MIGSLEDKTADESLYSRLQSRSLERLQQLCGEVWTDYNVHDPGVTICDVLNYALTEADYRFRFGWKDYLTTPEGDFRPGDYGLFDRTEVFPVSPVTPADYRKWIAGHLREVVDIRVCPAEQAEAVAGWYEIFVELLPGTGIASREKVRRQVERLFHASRNLCEGLAGVVFTDRKPLVLEGEIGLEQDADVTAVAVAIYRETQQFFVPGIRYCPLEELLERGMGWEDLLEGPLLSQGTVAPGAAQRQQGFYSVSGLYRRLKGLEGIKDIRALAFRRDGESYTDAVYAESRADSFTVAIPQKTGDGALRLKVGDVTVEPDYSRLSVLLEAAQARHYGSRYGMKSASAFMQPVPGIYRSIYEHDSVQNDFPECYAIGERGVAASCSERRKAQASQLKAYLLLADEVFARGYRELERLPRLLDLQLPPEEETIEPLRAPEVRWDQLVKEEAALPANGRMLREKDRWAEMLDRIYGEESMPGWLKAYNIYGDAQEEILMRRLQFLKQVPRWGHDRNKGVDLFRPEAANMPGIKAYMAALLGFASSGEQPVMNVFPMYNLRLIPDGLFYRYRDQLLSHNLVEEELLQEEKMEKIPEQPGLFTDADYRLLRSGLPLLHYNLLFEGLFREGIRMESYRLLNLPFHSDRLLMFFHRGRQEWINLGRFGTAGEVVDTANALRRFLVMLNRKCETLYVLEHLYISGESFAVTIVLPGWSVRFAEARFRTACEETVCRRLPAHLKVGFRWLAPRQMWHFERAYYAWRQALATGKDSRIWTEKLKKFLL